MEANYFKLKSFDQGLPVDKWQVFPMSLPLSLVVPRKTNVLVRWSNIMRWNKFPFVVFARRW